jgi:hypothetical protein
MKKIEGYVTSEDHGPGYELGNGAGWTDFMEGNQPEGIEGITPATLVIGSPGDKQAPRVFTEQEVVKMLREAYYINPETTDTYLSDLASRHSIELLTPTDQ